MKKENTATRLKQIMSDTGLRQVDILAKTMPYCKKYDVKMNKSDLSQYCSGKTEPNQDKLFVLSLALNVNEAWLMGYDVPMERNDYEDQNLLKRDAILEDIEHILELEKYTLCCEDYASDYFLIKNQYGQTISGFYDYELLTKYESLQKKGKVTAQLLISSNAVFLKYLESLGYHIYKNDSERKLLLTLKNSETIHLEYDTFDNLKSQIEKYTIATIDSKILALKESELRKERLKKEKLIQHLQNDSLSLDAANDRGATAEQKKNADDIMHDDSEWE